MKSLFALLVVILTFVPFSSQNCSPDIHLERTNSTIYFCDVNDANSTFVLSKAPPNTVDWTLEGKRYKVLGSEQCLPGQGYTHDFENFVCNPDLSLTADRLAQLIFLCSGSNNLPVWNGTAWTCGFDLDLLGGLNCSEGQVPKFSNATGTWECAKDNDSLGDLVAACPGAFTPIYLNGRFGCVGNKSVDNDTLRDLIPNCTNGYIPKYVGGKWVCAVDNNFLAGFTCPTGQILLRVDNNTWGCGFDRDTFTQNLTFNCSTLPPGFDTPILNETGWTCKQVPVYNVSANLGTVLYVNVYKYDLDGTQTDYFVGYYPFRIPYKGTLKAFGVRPIPVDGNTANVDAYVTVNGAEAPGTRIVRSFPSFGIFSIQGLDVPVNAGDTFDAVIASTGAIVYISTEIYIQLDTA